MGNPTRKEIEAVLDRGESFLLGDRHITTKDQIPPDEELAGDDKRRQADLRRDTEDQIRQLQDRLHRLETGQVASPPAGTLATTAVPETDATVPVGEPGNPSAPRVDAEDVPGQGTEERTRELEAEKVPDGPQLPPGTETAAVNPQDPRKPPVNPEDLPHFEPPKPKKK